MVSEASFNMLRPDTRHWQLSQDEAGRLTTAWLQRLLVYPDHVSRPRFTYLARRRPPQLQTT